MPIVKQRFDIELDQIGPRRRLAIDANLPVQALHDLLSRRYNLVDFELYTRKRCDKNGGSQISLGDIIEEVISDDEVIVVSPISPDGTLQAGLPRSTPFVSPREQADDAVEPGPSHHATSMPQSTTSENHTSRQSNLTTIAPKARKVGGRNAKVAYQSLTTSLKDIHARLYVFLRNRALSWKNLRVLVSCSTPQLLKITRALLGHITTDLESIQEGSSLLPSKCILFLDDVPCNLVSKMHIAIQIGFPPSDEHLTALRTSILDGGTFLLALSSAETVVHFKSMPVCRRPRPITSPSVQEAAFARTAISKAARGIPQQTKSDCYHSLLRLFVKRFPLNPALAIQELHRFLFETLRFNRGGGKGLLMVDEELFGEIVQLEQYGVEVRRVVQADALIDVATTI